MTKYFERLFVHPRDSQEVNCSINNIIDYSKNAN